MKKKTTKKTPTKRTAKKTVGKKTTRKKTVAKKKGGDIRRDDGTWKGDNPYSWKPGQSGNPNGRPKTTLLSTAYKRWLATTCFDAELIVQIGLDPDCEWTWADVISLGMIRSAVAGKTTAAKEIRETTEGSTLAIKPDWQGALADMGVDPETALQQLVEQMDKLL